MLKSKGSINEVNQIAQVCYWNWLLAFQMSFDKDMKSVLFVLNVFIVGCYQLRIIVKPKPCVGVGPLCSPQQVSYCHCQRIKLLCTKFTVFIHMHTSCRYATMFLDWFTGSGHLSLELWVFWYYFCLEILHWYLAEGQIPCIT